MPSDETIDGVGWLIGLALLCTGSSLQWGWPTSLIAFGLILMFWPLVRKFRT